MNNYDFLTSSSRKKTLIIVEGEHEKDTLFGLLLKCFPEIEISPNDIVIYGTNIYNLYQDIVRAYNDLEETLEEWENAGVDLPYVISTKKGIAPPYYKRNFNNILLIFDYERHHPRFSESQITLLQQYFNDVADNGQLYLNYPMIESYQHFSNLPDPNYENLSVSAHMQTGSTYKNLMQTTYTFVSTIVDFPSTLKGQLINRFNVADSAVLETCLQNLLNIKSADNLFNTVYAILLSVLEGRALQTASHYFTHLISGMRYIALNISYYEYTKWLFCNIALHNIRKASKIQNNIYNFPITDAREYFHNLDWTNILAQQNHFSRSGNIWVLNTSSLFIPNYNFELITSDIAEV